MPDSAGNPSLPIPLAPPPGVSLPSSPVLRVNDYGHIIANGNFTSNGESAPILWKVSGNAVTASILPPLPGGVAGERIGVELR
jgi:hypothetical protein